jgi:hypothetical protein
VKNPPSQFNRSDLQYILIAWPIWQCDYAEKYQLTFLLISLSVISSVRGLTNFASIRDAWGPRRMSGLRRRTDGRLHRHPVAFSSSSTMSSPSVTLEFLGLFPWTQLTPGASVFRLKANGLTIWLDAWIDRPSNVRPISFTTNDVTEADWILTSHAHFDRMYIS